MVGIDLFIFAAPLVGEADGLVALFAFRIVLQYQRYEQARWSRAQASQVFERAMGRFVSASSFITVSSSVSLTFSFPPDSAKAEVSGFSSCPMADPRFCFPSLAFFSGCLHKCGFAFSSPDGVPHFLKVKARTSIFRYRAERGLTPFPPFFHFPLNRLLCMGL